jgi:hypothetical protein
VILRGNPAITRNKKLIRPNMLNIQWFDCTVKIGVIVLRFGNVLRKEEMAF